MNLANLWVHRPMASALAGDGRVARFAASIGRRDGCLVRGPLASNSRGARWTLTNISNTSYRPQYLERPLRVSKAHPASTSLDLAEGTFASRHDGTKHELARTPSDRITAPLLFCSELSEFIPALILEGRVTAVQYEIM
jgi:hypothetical protein